MMKSIKILALICSSIALTIANSVNAQVAPKRNSIGPAIEFGNITQYGIKGKLGITPEFSVRPIILFGDATSYGLALTYDLNSPESKLSGYVGPRILFTSASGSGLDAFGVPTTASVSTTDIGLTAGADYAISDNFTAGLNATYNFSSSGTLDASNALGERGSRSGSGSGGFKFGINLGYSF
jgi:hypothetical protein